MHKIIEPKSLYWGNTVILLSTADAAGKTNITPISSSWSLGKGIVIGLSLNGKAIENIEERPEVVLNVASADLADRIEAIARFTGKDPVPPEKQKSGFTHCADKFTAARLTPQISLHVSPVRIAECLIQVECGVEHITRRGSFAIVELQTRCVHADEGVLKDSGIIDAAHWQPLIYNFRSYHGITETLGQNFRFEN